MTNNQLQKNISNEWQLIPVSGIFEFVKTYSFSRDNLTTELLSSNQVGCIHYGDIHSTYTGTTVDISRTKIPCINNKGFSPKKEELLKDGDLVMADASEDYGGVGVTISIHGIGKNKVVGGLHTFVLRDEYNKTTEYYRQYIFRNKEIRNKLQKVANGVSVYGISKTALSKMFLPIPAISEQNRIVSVLETWDKSIENLNRKIEIKKQIKKGLMQDLLTGKKRLSGFKDKWEELKLENIGEIVTGNTPSKKVSEYYGDKYLWATAFDFNGVYIEDTEIKLSESGKNTARMVPAGSILVTCIASIGKNAIAKKETAFNQQINAIIPNKKHNSEFIYYLIENFAHKLKEVAGGGALAMISKSVFGKIKLVFPKLEEQNAIANILTTADKEIIELENKLSLIKDQKKFLLNNLITGAIRTPEKLKIN